MGTYPHGVKFTHFEESADGNVTRTELGMIEVHNCIGTTTPPPTMDEIFWYLLVKMCVTSNSDLEAIWKPLGSELQDRFINAFSLYLNCKFELIQG